MAITGAAVEARHAANDRGVAFDANVRAEASHLQHVHEAVLEDRLGHRRDAFRDRVQRRELRLHIRRERGIRRGTKIDGLRPATAHVQVDPGIADFDLRARFAKLQPALASR